MAEESYQEKTEEPTQKRLDDAREEGNLPKSQELGSSMILLTGVVALYFMGSTMWQQMSEVGYFLFDHAVEIDITTENLPKFTEIAIFHMVKLIAPFCALLTVVGILTGIGQTGPNLTLKPLEPKFNKMDPIKGAKRAFSRCGQLWNWLKVC